MGNLCSIIFFSPAPWPTESERFCYLWVLNDDDSSHSTRFFCQFGVYGMIWYQSVIDAHQLENGQKPQRLSIYFELNNRVQKGKRIIFDINPCIFCVYWVINTSFYSKLKIFLTKIFKISLHHLTIPVPIALSNLYIIKCKVFRYLYTIMQNLLRKKEIRNGNIFEFFCVLNNIDIYFEKFMPAFQHLNA